MTDHDEFETRREPFATDREWFLTFERFETLGEHISEHDVPAAVRAGRTVWSWGYGDDPTEFTTIETDDLWAFEGPELDPDVRRSWAPFRLEV